MPVTVLCVNDDNRVLMARSLVLSIGGYNVQTAASGDTAIHLFARYDIDIVIADQFLPVVSGTQLTKLMKEVKPEVQVLLLADTPEMTFTPNHVDMVLPNCMEPEQLLTATRMLAARRRPTLVPAYKKVANSN